MNFFPSKNGMFLSTKNIYVHTYSQPTVSTLLGSWHVTIHPVIILQMVLIFAKTCIFSKLGCFLDTSKSVLDYPESINEFLYKKCCNNVLIRGVSKFDVVKKL